MAGINISGGSENGGIKRRILAAREAAEIMARRQAATSAYGVA